MEINLNNFTGTYSNLITSNLNVIDDFYYDESCTTEDLKNKILEITSPAKDTDAKRNFVENIKAKKNKDDIIMYVYNVNARAQHLSANPDDKWNTK